MIKFIKQLFCSHKAIDIKTETDIGEHSIKCVSTIKCAECGKSFKYHPRDRNAVDLLHTQMASRYLFDKINTMGKT